LRPNKSLSLLAALAVGLAACTTSHRRATLGPLRVKADTAVVADVADLVGGQHVALVARNKPADISFTAKQMIKRLPVQPSKDTHVWLSPPLMERIVGQVVDRLTKEDRRSALDYRRNADAYLAELVELDARFGEQLAGCRNRSITTNRNAFSWLAARYGLTQEIDTAAPDILDPIDTPGHSYLAAMDGNLERLRQVLDCPQ
jgi:ABC-type Zn uptake system ZnuABC Zn-binding protein ZnuA